MQKFKVGDKVMWDNSPTVCGTVVEETSSGFKVVWTGSTYLCEYHNPDSVVQGRITLFEDNQYSQMSEQQSVALLLSLGYTISKQPMVTNISNKT